LHLVAGQNKAKSADARRRQQRSQRQASNRKTTKSKSASKSEDQDEDVTEEEKSSSSVWTNSAKECPECGMDMISTLGPRTKRCDVCRHEWV
jgi:transposase-like protein